MRNVRGEVCGVRYVPGCAWSWCAKCAEKKNRLSEAVQFLELFTIAQPGDLTVREHCLGFQRFFLQRDIEIKFLNLNSNIT